MATEEKKSEKELTPKQMKDIKGGLNVGGSSSVTTDPILPPTSTPPPAK
ncbi:MAG: hypothetical protein ACLQDV_15725 [Candidatus Binataceae bacterium]